MRSELLSLALRRHQAGNLAQAEQLYRQVLGEDEGNVNALRLLGVLLFQTGRHDPAIDYLRQAVRLQPDLAETHFNLGNALKARGRLEEAEAAYREALRLAPQHRHALNNLGNLYLQQEKPEEAEACYRAVLRGKPDDAETLNNLGNALMKLGRLEEAESHLRQALRLQANLAAGHNNLGNLLVQQKKSHDAVASYQQAVRCQPDWAEAHYNLGIALKEANKPPEAILHLQRAIRLKPRYAEALFNLGNVLSQQGKLDDAVASLQQSLHSKPDFAEAHYNLGNILSQQEKLDDAVASFRQALRCKSDWAEAHYNLALVLVQQGKREKGLASYDQAVRCQPDYADARHNRSMLLLRLGRYVEGWPEYDWRWRCKQCTSLPPPLPVWDGAPLSGRTIVLWAEQGLGDTLQFIRFAALVKERGGTTFLACQRPLLRLLARCPGVDDLASQDVPLPPAATVCAPLLSLPGILGTTLDTIPSRPPYLFADESLLERWRGELAAFPGLKIGIAWQGNPTYYRDERRSLRLAQFEPLTRLPGVQLFSLQVGRGREQLAQGNGRFPVVDLGGRLEEQGADFMDTAAVVKNLDLVITVDTAIGHLAGALAVPVWVLLSWEPCWRWLVGRQDTPWYPTMRVFQQEKAGDWPAVFARIAAAVQERVAVADEPAS